MPVDAKKMVIAILVFSFLLIPIWSAKYPAILDYPSHLIRVKVAKDLNNRAFDYADHYSYQWFPRTYLFFDLFTYTFSVPFGIHAAGKITLSIYVLLVLLSTLYVTRVLGGSLFPMVLWPAVVTHNWWLGSGSVNMLAGYAVSLFLLGFVWQRRTSLGHRSIAVASALLIASFLCHPFSFLTSCAALLVVGLKTVRGSDRRKCIALLACALLIAVFSTIYHVAKGVPFEFITKYHRITWMFHSYNPPVEKILFKAMLFFVFLFWAISRKELYRSVLLPGFLFFLSFILPTIVSAPGNENIRMGFIEMRTVMFLLFVVPFVFPVVRQKKLKVAFSVVLLTFGAMWNVFQTKNHLQHKPFFEELDKIIEILPQNPKMRPLLKFTGHPTDLGFFYIPLEKGGEIPFPMLSAFLGIRPRSGYNRAWGEMHELKDADIADVDYLLAYKRQRADVRGQLSGLTSATFKSVYEGRLLTLMEKHEPSGP